MRTLVVLWYSTEFRRTVAALRKSERKFGAISDQTLHFVGSMTIDGMVIEANQPRLRLIDAKESELIGKRESGRHPGGPIALSSGTSGIHSPGG